MIASLFVNKVIGISKAILKWHLKTMKTLNGFWKMANTVPYHDCKLFFVSISSILIILSRTHLNLPIFPYLLLLLHNPSLYLHPILRLPCLYFHFKFLLFLDLLLPS